MKNAHDRRTESTPEKGESRADPETGKREREDKGDQARARAFLILSRVAPDNLLLLQRNGFVPIRLTGQFRSQIGHGSPLPSTDEIDLHSTARLTVFGKVEGARVGGNNHERPQPEKAKPNTVQRRYLVRGLAQAGGKLPLFDEDGQQGPPGRGEGLYRSWLGGTLVRQPAQIRLAYLQADGKGPDSRRALDR